MIELSDVYEYFGGLGWGLLEDSPTRQFWTRPNGSDRSAGIEISGLCNGETKMGQSFVAIGRLQIRQKQPHEAEVCLEDALLTVAITSALVDDLGAVEAAFHLLNRSGD